MNHELWSCVGYDVEFIDENGGGPRGAATKAASKKGLNYGTCTVAPTGVFRETNLVGTDSSVHCTGGKSLNALDSCGARTHISCDGVSTFHPSFCQIVHRL